MKLRKVKREIIFLKPSGLKLKELLEANQDDWTRQNIKKHKLEFILNAVIRSGISNCKELDDHDTNYASVCAEQLQRVVDNYKDYLQFLLQHNILQTDGHYILGEKCTGFALAPPYNSQPIVETVVTNYSLRKSVRNEINRRIKEDSATTRGYGYLTRKWETDKIDVDVEGAFKTIDEIISKRVEEIPKSYSKRIRLEKTGVLMQVRENFKQQVKRIKDKDYRCRFSGLGRRFYNPISNLKRELRNYLTYDGETLVDIDITNSQPFMSLVLFNPEFWKRSFNSKKVEIYFRKILSELYNELNYNNNINSFIMLSSSSETHYHSELQRFEKLVLSGKFYDYIQDNFKPHFPHRFATRQKTKVEVLIMFFSNPALHYGKGYEPCLLFKEHFPMIYKLFTSLQAIAKNTLPSILQRIESFLMLDVVCKTISQLHPKIWFVTIHDNIITTKKNEAIVKEIMTSEIQKWTGHIPPIDSKDLVPPRSVHRYNIDSAETFSALAVDQTGLYEVEQLAPLENSRENRKVVDLCTGQEFFNTQHASIVRGIDHEELIGYLAGDTNPTCLEYKCN